MRFSVSVPVLSEQMYVTEPSVSTAGSRRISAFCRTIRRAPSASETVTTAGSASGIAATARLTAVRNIRISGSPREQPGDEDHHADREHGEREPPCRTARAVAAAACVSPSAFSTQSRDPAELGSHAGRDDDARRRGRGVIDVPL